MDEIISVSDLTGSRKSSEITIHENIVIKQANPVMVTLGSSVKPVIAIKNYRTIGITQLRKREPSLPDSRVMEWLNTNYDSMFRYLEVIPEASSSQTKHEPNGILDRRDYHKVINNTTLSVKTTPTLETSLNKPKTCDETGISNSPIVITSKENSEVDETERTPYAEELQKKLEFYDYLELVDKDLPRKKVCSETTVKNRRSTRVRNLALLNEKRQTAVQNSAKTNKTGRSSNTLSENGRSKYSKKSRSSLSVELRHVTSPVENRPKSSLQHSSNGSTSQSRMGNIFHRSLQVPEITSTSIACNNKMLSTSINTLNTCARKPNSVMTNSELTSNAPSTVNKMSSSASRANKSLLFSASNNPINACASKPNDVMTNNYELLSNAATVENQLSHKTIRPRSYRHSTSTVSNSSTRKSNTTSNHNSSKINLSQSKTPKNSSKIIKKRHFGNPRQLKRLRSSGAIKRLQLKTVLLKSKKRKISKKKWESTTPSKSETSKSFTRIDLIQPGIQLNSENQDEDVLFENGFSSDNDEDDSLTPIHRLALRERARFLMNNKGYDEPFIGFGSDELNKSVVAFQKIEFIVECLEEYVARRVKSTSQYTCEDLEVGQFMNKFVKKFVQKTTVNSNELSSSGNKCSITGDNTSYPQSSVIMNSERETSTDFISNIDASNELTEPDVYLSDPSPEVINNQEVVDVSLLKPNDCKCQEVELDKETPVKSLGECLTKAVLKPKDLCTQQKCTKLSLSHTVCIAVENGDVIEAHYLDFNLIIVQKSLVSFWNKTPLGNVMGAQDMWLPKGHATRLILENGCVRRESSEVVVSLLNSTAYVELWIKEHISEKRERPLADIFVAIYLVSSPGGCSKQVLQLENIHGFAKDVQYIVLRNSRNIIVSWNIINEDISSTLIHCYEFSEDYQTVQSVKGVQTVNHYVASLHNIEDCDNIIMGCGEQKISLWNVEDLDCCYIIATIDLASVLPFRTLWAKCDRGFLFTLHELNNGHIQLIAINSNASTWKRLKTYKNAEFNYNRLTGMCIESGILIVCYDTGMLCWNAQSGDLILESPCDNQLFLTKGSNIVLVLNNEIQVRQALEHIISTEDI